MESILAPPPFLALAYEFDEGNLELLVLSYPLLGATKPNPEGLFLVELAPVEHLESNVLLLFFIFMFKFLTPSCKLLKFLLIWGYLGSTSYEIVFKLFLNLLKGGFCRLVTGILSMPLLPFLLRIFGLRFSYSINSILLS